MIVTPDHSEDIEPQSNDLLSIDPEFSWRSKAGVITVSFEALDGHCDFLNAQEELLRIRIRTIMSRVAGKNWPDLPFESAFSQLNAATRYEHQLPIDDLVKSLESRVHEAGERVELFGAKLPFSLLGNLGTLALLAVQLYLLVQLSELRSILEVCKRESAGPYMGIYGQVLARVITASSLLLPPATLALLAVKNWKVTPFYSAVAAGFAISAILSFRTLGVFRRIWKVKPDVNPSKDMADNVALDRFKPE